MDGFDCQAAAACNRGDRIDGAGQRRQPIAWAGLLAIATATAILISGLNGLVQIVKVAIDYGYAHRG